MDKKANINLAISGAAVALGFFTARLGPDHPHTQTVHRNLAALPD
jgi:hypothetical protein